MLAILDGQQRLTALNIAAYGSLAVKKPCAWASNPSAFPKKRLYLNLLSEPNPDELALAYELRFLADEEAQAPDGAPDAWYRAGDILNEEAGPPMMNAIANRGITDGADIQTAFDRFAARDHARSVVAAVLGLQAV
ncbi:MAG: hypothetical protein ACYCST_09625 [Acidimicrobiales bacterium]